MKLFEFGRVLSRQNRREGRIGAMLERVGKRLIPLTQVFLYVVGGTRRIGPRFSVGCLA
jgi:hypothetical protein